MGGMIRSAVVAISLLFITAIQAQPLIHGHAHNDYWHAWPLFEALNDGFVSVEADVHLLQGELRVGHSPEEAIADRTLKKLYLDPLKQRAASKEAPRLTLVIDIKSEPEATYAALLKLLANYHEILTSWHDNQVEPRAVTVILTGGFPRATIEAEKTRWVALDGGLEDLDRTPSSSSELMPRVQANWRDHFKWRGEGPMPESERAKLKALIAKAHAQHRQIRFWNLPDRLNVWRELRADGVDLINTDDLRGCSEFLRREDK
jgi:hypothetical protein